MTEFRITEQTMRAAMNAGDMIDESNAWAAAHAVAADLRAQANSNHPARHEFTTDVRFCREHDLGDCPYHASDRACTWQDDDSEPCGRDRTDPRHHLGDEAVTAAPAETPRAWTPEQGTSPIAQYRMTIFVTGIAVAPPALAWAVTKLLAVLGLTARVERIEQTL